MIREILGVRLFGYGVPYRARFERGVVEPLETGPETEAADLAQALARLRGAPGTPGSDDAWALSMPFGRCGLNGLPREHLRVFAAREAWLDLLTWDGPQEVAVAPGRAGRHRTAERRAPARTAATGGTGPGRVSDAGPHPPDGERRSLHP